MTLLEKITAHPRYRKLIQDLNETDFSHNFDHFRRVCSLALRIGEEEGADLEVLEAASLLFDLARNLEDRKEVKDHARAGAEIAAEILKEIKFPDRKIEAVRHAITVHRKSHNHNPEMIEAKILQDADYLDAMGAINIARIFGSSFQSAKYKRPIFLDDGHLTGLPFEEANRSAIHYAVYQLEHPKLQPKNFWTKTGRVLARRRYKFLKIFVDEFIKEWRGED